MTSDGLTLIFLALHILSAGVWISQFVAEMALERFARTIKGKAGEAALALAEGNIASMMGTVGGTGILITGLVLTFQFHYGILGIGGVHTPLWLVIKQVVYIVAMAIVGALVTRPSRPVMEQIGKAAAEGQPVPAEAAAAFDRIKLMSRVVNLLVLINIFVGVFGVNGGFMQ